jgi:hypothetical protein
VTLGAALHLLFFLLKSSASSGDIFYAAIFASFSLYANVWFLTKIGFINQQSWKLERSIKLRKQQLLKRTEDFRNILANIIWG